MKIRLVVVSVLTFIAALIPATSHAADDRYFQYGKTDVSNPDGLNAYFDITSIQVALTSSGYIQFYVKILPGVDPEKFRGKSYVGIALDTDGKTGSEFIFTTSEVVYYGSSRSTLKVFDVRTEETPEVNNCDGTTWITSTKDAVGFEILASCMKAPNGASVAGFANDGIVSDYSPELGDDFKIKTNYMSTKSCTAKTKDNKFVYSSTQFVCNQKNGKWVWVDYAPIAAAKAKYLTEKAFYSCRLNTNALGAELSDKGKTLELDGVYKYLVSDAQFACVTSVLAMPSSVKSKLSMTRALDGIQNAKFGKLSADWSYHPDDGLSITFTYN
jgi:hypothetical protein